MVERETITLDAAALQMLVVGGEARRGRGGPWTVIIQLNGEVALDDGRSLSVRKEVRVKVKRQNGRKPNPAQNWGKGGGFRPKK